MMNLLILLLSKAAYVQIKIIDMISMFVHRLFILAYLSQFPNDRKKYWKHIYLMYV